MHHFLNSQRDQWFLWLPVILGAGIVHFYALDFEPKLHQIGALLSAALIGAIICYRKFPGLLFFFIILIPYSLGMMLAAYETYRAAQHALFPYQEAYVWVRGDVEKIEEREHGKRLTLGNLDLWQPEHDFTANETPELIRINVRTQMPENLNPGDRIAVQAILSPPPELPAYPEGYNFRQYAFLRHIGAVGFSVSEVTIRSATDQATLSSIRRHVTQTIQHALSDYEKEQHIATALLTAERGAIDRDILEIMREIGLGHLLAISGLHLALVMSGIYVLFRTVIACIPYVALRINSKRIGAVLALIFGFSYLLLTGLPVSAQRAYIMMFLFFLAILTDRTGSFLRPVAWAALIILVVDPSSILSPSFQMSFSAVIGLISVFKVLPWFNRQGTSSISIHTLWLYVIGILISSMVAGLATAPYAIYHFGRYANYGFLANLAAIPLTSFWIMPMGMVSLVLMPLGLEFIGLVPMAWGIDVLIAWSYLIHDLPEPSTAIPAFAAWTLALFTLGALWLCLWQGRIRLAGIPVMLVALILSILTMHVPDIMIDRTGKLLAVRDKQGNLVFSSLQYARFVREQWLGMAGRQKDSAIPHRDSDALTCSDNICTYHSGAYRLIYSMESMHDIRCEDYDIIITAGDNTLPCETELMITKSDLDRNGSHFIWLEDEIIVANTYETLPNRLWTVRY